ncbi:MAG: hypothetical protein CME32_25875 [Gimesia sp.]|nr:hypothetical protein [Gimesia sp.]
MPGRCIAGVAGSQACFSGAEEGGRKEGRQGGGTGGAGGDTRGAAKGRGAGEGGRAREAGGETVRVAISAEIAGACDPGANAPRGTPRVTLNERQTRPQKKYKANPGVWVSIFGSDPRECVGLIGRQRVEGAAFSMLNAIFGDFAMHFVLKVSKF